MVPLSFSAMPAHTYMFDFFASSHKNRQVFPPGISYARFLAEEWVHPRSIISGSRAILAPWAEALRMDRAAFSRFTSGEPPSTFIWTMARVYFPETGSCFTSGDLPHPDRIKRESNSKEALRER